MLEAVCGSKPAERSAYRQAPVGVCKLRLSLPQLLLPCLHSLLPLGEPLRFQGYLP